MSSILTVLVTVATVFVAATMVSEWAARRLVSRVDPRLITGGRRQHDAG